MSRIAQHPTAVVEDGVTLGEGVAIWASSRVCTGARIGTESRLGTGVYVGADVKVGARCKIENGAQVFEGACLGDGVFVGPHAVLTNDRRPRAVAPDGRLKEAVDWKQRGVTVDEGASIGAGAVVVGGVHLGAWSMVAAGAVVSRTVGQFDLVAGIPARQLGWVCMCGDRIEPPGACPECCRRYAIRDQTVVETRA